MSNLSEAGVTDASRHGSRYASTVYYAENVIATSLEEAWNRLIDYRAWNPSFVNATVVSVKGEYRAEGERVLISKSTPDYDGEPIPDFYAETVKVEPLRHIVWYIYPVEGDAFRNFVDFMLTETPGGVKFDILYYEQNHASEEELRQHRKDYQHALEELTKAFQRYCERRI